MANQLADQREILLTKNIPLMMIEKGHYGAKVSKYATKFNKYSKVYKENMEGIDEMHILNHADDEEIVEHVKQAPKQQQILQPFADPNQPQEVLMNGVRHTIFTRRASFSAGQQRTQDNPYFNKEVTTNRVAKHALAATEPIEEVENPTDVVAIEDPNA
jgi:predicted RNA-binding Zn ribbon-like protein